MQQEERQFLTDQGKYLTTSTNKLCSALDALQCKLFSWAHARNRYTAV